MSWMKENRLNSIASSRRNSVITLAGPVECVPQFTQMLVACPLFQLSNFPTIFGLLAAAIHMNASTLTQQFRQANLSEPRVLHYYVLVLAVTSRHRKCASKRIKDCNWTAKPFR